ncbi:hypothetical protein BGZ96_008284 [Linnemannia gamsii]|uniref:Uncharacterized protein n=1 Tax=Linnemannia gamsii TaxID=64522 RepID=A0ABQ7JZ78_9FUNG|nr:hypothetical protein BGZ96_008284 [Linnemannia gamsii]
MLFTPNTQAIETTAVVGTPVTARLLETFSSIVATPEQEDSQEESSSAAGISTASFIKRPCKIAFKEHEDEVEEVEEEEGDVGDNSGAETPLGTGRILPSRLIRRSEPERDPFLQTPRPTDGRDPFNQELGHDEEVDDKCAFDEDVVLDEADLDQDFRSSAADTAFIFEDRDSIAELIYEHEDLEEERKRRREAMELIRANRSFELGMKAAAEEAARAAAATAATAAQELLDASAESMEAEVEAVEMDEKILKRQLDAELGRVMSIFEGEDEGDDDNR